MDISLDKPGFGVGTTDAEVHRSDPPRSSGSSSTSSGDSTRRSCTKCHGRMSSLSLDKHLFCMKCRGSECTMNTRCSECMSWTEEEMIKYSKLRKSLSSKSKRSKSSPRSIPQDRDADEFNQAQLDSVQKLINDSITSMSDNLMAKFSSMFDQYQYRQHNISCTSSSAVPGQSATHTEPASRLPTDRITCPEGRRFRKGHEDTVPHEDISVCDSMDETPETPRHPPGDTGEPQDLRRAPAFVRHHQTGAGLTSRPEEDEDDDERHLEADEPQLEKSFVRLLNYVQDRFPHSIPASAPRELPRCEFEEFFSTSDTTSSAKPILTLYPQVDEILDSCADRAARYAKESKPLHRVLPFKRRATPVGDRPDFCMARFLNTDFSRISRHKKILRSRASSMTLSDLERLDQASRSVIAGQSQSFWLLSSLLAQLRDEGFKPADPNLFDQSITALSASLASQTSLTSAMSEFVTAKRRESYLAHTSCPVGESVNRELLVAPGTDNLLFNHPLLEKVVSNIKEDSLISSTASLASISKAASRGRSGASGSGGSSSPLDFSRPSTSGYRKRSASPPRGGNKRACRGRGRTPSSSRSKGFRR